MGGRTSALGAGGGTGASITSSSMNHGTAAGMRGDDDACDVCVSVRP